MAENEGALCSLRLTQLNTFMKLTEMFENDYSDQAGMKLPQELLEVAYEAILPTELSFDEIKDLAKELVDNDRWGNRTVGSAKFVLTRMHVLVHGMAPYDISERSAEQMFIPPRTMEDFVETKGIDVDSQISAARAEIKRRPKKLKKKAALTLFRDYAHENPDMWELIKPTVSGSANYINRNRLIDLLMAGESPEDAFKHFM